MALVIEDGSGSNPAANSYVTVAEIRDYADLRSVELPADDADVIPLAIKAMDWLESLRYAGEKIALSQPLSFPRSGVYVDGFLLPSDEVPKELKYAQMAAALEANEGDIMPNKTGQGAVSSESVGPVSVSYATTQGAQNNGPTAFSKPYALVRHLLAGGGLMMVRRA